MADHFIGINRGVVRNTGDALFTVGTSTGSTDVEVRIADAAGWEKKDLYNMVRAIADFIQTQSQYPVL